MSITEDILKKWRKGSVPPVWVFHGEEDFLRAELLHEAPSIFVPDESTRPFNSDVLYGPETTIDQVISLARSFPMMAERRLIIVREAERVLRTRPEGAVSKSRKKQNDDPLLQYLDNPNPDTVLIFDLDKFGARNQSPFKELAAKAQVIEFPIMKENDVVEWIRTRAAAAGRKISLEAARMMTAYLGISLRNHANELEKLLSFSTGPEIGARDVEQVVGASRENNVFELTKAIGAGNKPLAVSIALKLLDQGKDQRQFIFVMLSRFIEQLIIAREMSGKNEAEKSIAEAIGLYGGAAYFVKEIVQQARRYSRERLDLAMKAIVEAEAQTRRVSTNDELLIEKLVLSLVSG
jgi:DNA polymerase-3 subunit delta